MKSIKITLDEPHLRALIRGGEVKVTVQGVIVKMILSDIGFSVIDNIVDDTRDRKDHMVGVGYEDEQ